MRIISRLSFFAKKIIKHFLFKFYVFKRKLFKYDLLLCLSKPSHTIFLVFNFNSYFIFQFIAFMIIILFMVKSLN